MIPVRLTISGFLSYQEPVTIDFTPLRVACITGRNGAGKSSLLDAITWALFGEARKSDDSIINDKAPNNTAKVDFEFIFEGAAYLVRRSKPRGKSSSLDFFIRTADGKEWKSLNEKRVTDTNKRICDTLRMDYETFINVSFFLQGKADQFTGKKPTERKKILSTILNLDVWDDYKARAVEKRKAVEMEIGQLNRLIHENLDELRDEEELKKELEEVRTDLKAAREELTKAEEQWKLAHASAAALNSMKTLLEQKQRAESQQTQRIRTLERDLTTRRMDLAALQQRTSEAGTLKAKYETLKQLREQMEKWNALSLENNRLQGLSIQLSSAIQNRKKNLEYERDQLTLTKNAIEQKAAEQTRLEAELEQLNRESEALSGKISGIEQQQKQRDELRDEEAHLKADCSTMVSSANEIKEKTAYLQEHQGGICPTCGQEMDQAHCLKHIEELSRKLTEMRSEYREKNSRSQMISAQVETLSRSIAELGKLRAGLNGLTAKIAGTGQKIRMIRDSVEDWESSKKARLAEIERILRDADYCQDEQAKLSEVTAQIKALGYDGKQHEAVRQQISGLAGTEEAYRDLVTSLGRIEPLEKDIREKTEQLSREKDALETLSRERIDAERDYQEQKEQLPDLNLIEQVRNKTLAKTQAMESRHGEIQQKVRHLEEARSNTQRYEKEAKEKTRLAERYKALEKAFGKDGIPAILIEQAIPEIMDQANQILQQLSDGAMSLQINTQGSYKTKKDEVKETLDILIEDAYGIREYEMFSGGEAFRINFSLRLALSRILAHRSGSRLQTLVIDEGFGSQDAEGRELLIDAISKIQHDFEKILIITHLDELKERFPSRIEITKSEMDGSRAEVIP